MTSKMDTTTTEEEISDKGFSFSTSEDIGEDDERKFKYTRSVVRVTKSTLAHYVIMNKCVCLFMLWLHLTMGLLSLFIAGGLSEVTSESSLCRFIFYSSHYLYGYINLVITAIYLYLFASFSLKALQEMRQSDHIALFFICLVGYVLLLKIFADLNCTFWGISARQLVLQGLQFGIEGLLVKQFYSWLNRKTTVLRETLENNFDFISANMVDNKEQK